MAQCACGPAAAIGKTAGLGPAEGDGDPLFQRPVAELQRVNVRASFASKDGFGLVVVSYVEMILP